MPTAYIIGGGIAGCATALALAKTGWRVAVSEQRQGPAAQGAGIQISPNARKALDVLDVDLRTKLSFPKSVRIMDAGSQAPLSNYPLGSDFLHGFGGEYAVASRADLQAALWQACVASQAVDIRTGQPGDTSAEADLTVGADGVNSTVRHAVGRSSAQSTGYIACRTLLPFNHPAASCIPKDAVSLWLGRKAHAVIYPLDGDVLNIVLSTKGSVDSSGWSAAAPKQLITNIIGRLNPALKRLSDGVEFSQWDIRSVAVGSPWHRGSTVLIGDAAHAMPPFAAQGAAMALEDAVVLAAQLANTDSIQKGLAGFERARRPRVERMAALSQSNARLYHMSGPPAFARNLVLRSTPRAVINARMGWIYDWSPPELT